MGDLCERNSEPSDAIEAAQECRSEKAIIDDILVACDSLDKAFVHHYVRAHTATIRTLLAELHQTDQRTHSLVSAALRSRGFRCAGLEARLVAFLFGTASGVVTAKVMDLGIPDDWVAWFREAAQPGTTILALLVSDLNREALLDELKRFEGAHLVYANLDAGTLDRIHGALGEPPAPPAPAAAQ